MNVDRNKMRSRGKKNKLEILEMKTLIIKKIQ